MQTKIILELGCNHNGSIDIAKHMIDDAAKLGVWAVKFQKRDPESLSQGEKLIPRDIETSFGENYYEHRKALEFSAPQIKELKEYAESLGLVSAVSVFDMLSAEQMIELGFNYIKLPSQFYSHYALNKLLLDESFFSSKFNIIVSTGMHSLEETLNWQYFDKASITMYCRSIYPCGLNEIRFKIMQSLKENLRNSVLGYSSHDKNGEAIFYAVLLGSEYIERHYTLDKNMKGSDHKTVSSDFLEMQKIISDIKKAEELLNVSEKNPKNCFELFSEKEKAVRKIYRGF